MSSSVQQVKEELIHVSAKRRCCKLAELCAIAHVDGSYVIRGKEGPLLLTESPSAGTVRKVYTLLHSLFDLDTTFVRVTKDSPRRSNIFRLEVYDQPGFLQTMNEIGILDDSLLPLDSIPLRITRKRCCSAAAIRGAFLGGGYISEPYGKAELEISFPGRGTCLSVVDLLDRHGITAGIRERRGHNVLYLKRREDIASFLAVTGAHSAHLDWVSRSIINLTRSDVNRQVNCDAANANRLAKAAGRQREAALCLVEQGLLDRKDHELEELALARIANPGASLRELGELLDPPVTKAVVQNRMKKLEMIFEKWIAGDREAPVGG